MYINDKSLFLRDEFAMDVKTGNKFGDNKFKLYRYDESNEIITQEFQGAFHIVDNGYFEWSCMVNPYKKYKLEEADKVFGVFRVDQKRY